MNPEISKSARELLAKQPAAEAHPSPDLLNGYVEQSLNAAENTQVLTHLSSCAECREVVFLATGVAEEEMQPELLVAAAAKAAQERPLAAASPASDQLRGCAVLEPRPKRKTASWKWAAPLAAVILIGVTVLVERHETSGMLGSPGTQVAYERGLAPAVSAPSTPPMVQADKVEPQSPSNTLALSAPPPEEKDKMSAAYAAKKSEAAQREQALMNEAIERSDRQELASSLENHHADFRAGTAQAKTAPSGAPAVPSGEVASAAPNGGNDLTYLAPDAVKPQSLAKSSLMANDQAAVAVDAAAMPRHQAANSHWRIGKEGQLERSTGSGTWTQKLASEEVAFRAVATVGSDVWAGGNGGALFHSSDGGDRFNKVGLSANGQAESGSIVSIHFDTAQQGTVTTDSGATWTTTDGGHTWSKQ